MSRVKGSKHRNLVQLAKDADAAKEVVEAGGSVRDIDHKNIALRGLIEPTKQDELSIIALRFIREKQSINRDSYFEYMKSHATRSVASDTMHNLKRGGFIEYEGDNLKFLKVSKAIEIIEFDTSLLEKLENRVYTTKEIESICGIGKPTIINRLLSMVKRGKIESVGAGKWKLPGVEVDESVDVFFHRGDLSNLMLDAISAGVVTPNGIANRVGRALNHVTTTLNHLKKKGWIKAKSRGVWTLTVEGKEIYQGKKEN